MTRNSRPPAPRKGRPPTSQAQVTTAACELSDAALEYARRGWPVLPLHHPVAAGRCSCGHDDCASPGKHPRTRHGLLDATVDADTIREWWSRWPLANVGLAAGVPFHTLDIDIAGMGVMCALLEEHDAWLRNGPYVRTGSGGRHVFFAPPARDIGNRAAFVEGCDWRGSGGYVVAAPSMHASRRRYEWLRGPNRPLPEVPKWLLDLLDPPRPSLPVRRAVTQGSTHYAAAALDAEVRAVQDAPVGCRNHTLNTSSFNMGQLVGAGLLDRDVVIDALLDAARRVGLAYRETTTTIASGLRAGIAHPRQVAS